MKFSITNQLCLALLPMAALTMSCKDDLDPGDEAPDEVPADGNFTHTEHDGYTTTIANATSGEAWVYFDFDAKREVTQPDTDNTWDIAFKRYLQQTNGGVSGDQDVAVAMVEESFADVVAPPALNTFVADEADNDDMGEEAQTGFDEGDGWYDYNGETHELTPKDRTYVIRTTEGAYVKLGIVGYYDENGTSGMFTFDWAFLTGEPAAATWNLNIDASSNSEWVYISLTNRQVVTSADGWDISIKRTSFATNSGTTAAGLGGAATSEAATLEAITDIPSEFTVDAMLPNPGPPGSGETSKNQVLEGWYDYNFSTHVVSPRDQVFVVRGATGADYYGLKVISWADGLYQISFIDL